jgi:hypothetical protein
MALKSSNKKSRVWFRILSTLTVAAVLAFLYWFVWGSIWKINNVEIVDAKHTDVAALKSDVEDIIQQKKLLIIPNNHIVFLSSGRLEKHILETYPSVETVDISKTKDRDIVIKIQDRKATGVWCDENCFFFDDEGVLFKKAFTFTGAVFATWTSSASRTLKFYDKAPCVDTCIDKAFVSFLSKQKIKKVMLDEDDLRLYTEYGYYIKALNNSTTTMKNMDLFAKEYKGDMHALQYVDVRFGDKIFYK